MNKNKIFIIMFSLILVLITNICTYSIVVPENPINNLFLKYDDFFWTIGGIVFLFSIFFFGWLILESAKDFLYKLKNSPPNNRG